MLLDAGVDRALALMRERSGETQAQVFEATGVTVPTISAYERGTSKPSWPQLLKLCQHYGYDIILQRRID